MFCSARDEDVSLLREGKKLSDYFLLPFWSVGKGAGEGRGSERGDGEEEGEVGGG